MVVITSDYKQTSYNTTVGPPTSETASKLQSLLLFRLEGGIYLRAALGDYVGTKRDVCLGALACLSKIHKPHCTWYIKLGL